MNDLDYLILIILAIGVCIGLYRGFLKEAVGTLGLVLAAMAANFVSPYARPRLNEWVESETIAAVVVWLVTFLLAMFLLNKAAYLLGRVLRSVQLSWVNRLAGGLFGGIKYTLIIALSLMIVEFVCAHVDGLKVQTYLSGSRLVPVVHQVVDIVMPWASEHILDPALEMLKEK